MHLPKFDRKMKQIRRLIPLLFLISGYGFSQNLNSNTGHGGDYLVFDASKSIPGNVNIDRMSFMLSNSMDVELPSEIIQELHNIKKEDPPELTKKLSFKREIYLKALYNPNLSSGDKLFMCNYLIERNNESLSSIIPFIKDYKNKYLISLDSN